MNKIKLPETTTIHWLGAGLSSSPGIKELCQSGYKLTLWETNYPKLIMLKNRHNISVPAQKYSNSKFLETIKPGDLIVSMLTSEKQSDIIKIAIDTNCHFVSSSYIPKNISKLKSVAKKKQLIVLNEMGLDPGLDHLFSHYLVNLYLQENTFSINDHISFRSFCGGFPVYMNNIKYKFSWSPYGVLKSLLQPAIYINNGVKEIKSDPWKATMTWIFNNEQFDIYPNRDSTAYLHYYGFPSYVKVDDFIRATIRPNGWKHAWQQAGIFEIIKSANRKQLKKFANELFELYKYKQNESDRVLLYISLKINNDYTGKVWYKQIWLDMKNMEEYSNMSLCVSMPLVSAIKSLFTSGYYAGIHAASTNFMQVSKWLYMIKTHNINWHLDMGV